MLSFGVFVPPDFINKTLGLLGVFNNDTSDDFTYRNGSGSLNILSKEREIFQWGMTFMVNENESLFTYPAGENWSDYNDPSFTPVFLDEITNFSQSLIDLCENNTACMYDVLQSGNETIGKNTLQFVNFSSNVDESLNISPPTIHAERVIVGRSGQIYSLTIRVNVTKGGVSFKTNSSVTTLVSQENFTVTYNLNLTRDSANVSFLIETLTGDYEYKPAILICDCLNGGECLNMENRTLSALPGSYEVMECDCNENYTGVRCESQINGCTLQENPCYENVTCKRLTGTDYSCGPCPVGMTGDGKECIPEGCDDDSGCQQNCTRVSAIWQQCSCFDNYTLLNSTHCREIQISTTTTLIPSTSTSITSTVPLPTSNTAPSTATTSVSSSTATSIPSTATSIPSTVPTSTTVTSTAAVPTSTTVTSTSTLPTTTTITNTSTVPTSATVTNTSTVPTSTAITSTSAETTTEEANTFTLFLSTSLQEIIQGKIELLKKLILEKIESFCKSRNCTFIQLRRKVKRESPVEDITIQLVAEPEKLPSGNIMVKFVVKSNDRALNISDVYRALDSLALDQISSQVGFRVSFTDHGLSGASIVGIIIGVILAVIALTAVLATTSVVIRRNSKKSISHRFKRPRPVPLPLYAATNSALMKHPRFINQADDSSETTSTSSGDLHRYKSFAPRFNSGMSDASTVSSAATRFNPRSYAKRQSRYF